MRRADLDEAMGVWRAVVEAVASAPVDRATTEAADLRRACGAALANGRYAIQTYAFGATLRACFDAAGLAGAPAEFFARVRLAVEAMAPASRIAETVATLSLRLCLAAEGAALADKTFASRAEVEAALDRIRAAFEAAIDYAMAQREGPAFRALSALYAAVTRDLTERSRKMPRMAPYAVGAPLPSLALAHRLYADAGRAGELAAENAVVHPLFMPAEGRALTF